MWAALRKRSSPRPRQARSTKKRPLMFADLAEEIQAAIFSKLEPLELQQARLVSRTWNYIIGTVFNTKLLMNNTNWDTMVRTEAFRVMTVMTNLDRKLGNDVRFRSFCSKLHGLDIMGILMLQNYFTVLENCVFLETLKLNQVYLHYSKNSEKLMRRMRAVPESSLKNWLPQLEELHIDIPNEAHVMLLLEILYKILRNGKLRKIRLVSQNYGFGFVALRGFIEMKEIVPHAYAPGAGYYWLRKMIMDNRKTLESLELVRSLDARVLEGGTNVIIRFHPFPRNSEATRPIIKELISRKTLFRTRIYSDRNHDEPILQVLATQSRLQRLELGSLHEDGNTRYFNRFRLFVADVLRKNGRTLVHIYLDSCYRRTNDEPWDGAAFSGCVCLRKLELYHWPLKMFREYMETGGNFPRLVGLQNLPASLQELSTSLTLVFPNEVALSTTGTGNLGNLQKLVLNSSPWVLLDGSAVTIFSVAEFYKFEGIFPKLNHLELGLSGIVDENLFRDERGLKMSVSKVLKDPCDTIKAANNNIYIVLSFNRLDGQRPGKTTEEPSVPKPSTSKALPPILQQCRSQMSSEVMIRCNK